MKGTRSRLLATGVALVGMLALAALAAPLITPYEAGVPVADSLERPSADHWLGTDNIGADIFTALVWGGRDPMLVAVTAPSLALGLALVIGVGGSLVGGITDKIAMRVADLFMAIPGLPLLMLIGAFAGGGVLTVVLSIGVIAWPYLARVLRSQTLSLRQRGFVESAGGFGAGPLYVVRRHLVPALGPLLVTGFLGLAAGAIGLQAALAFLGLAEPGDVSWGSMLNQALNHKGLYFTSRWSWWVLPPGLALTVTMLGFTLIGAGLEPRFNPRWRRSS